MKITIIKRKVELKTDQEDIAISRCKRLYARYLDRISSVTIRLKDINGPKGGIDKECTLQLQLVNGSVLTSCKRHQHIQGAIQLSMETARSLLRRKLGERKRAQ